MQIRHYGSAGPQVILLHGGPGAPGYMAPVGRELSKSFRAIEPFQRASGKIPLTVKLLVEDLHDCIRDECGQEPVALLGHSWGAMLALAYAAEHPDFIGPLVLVGCGTFNEASRLYLEAERDKRLGEPMRDRLRKITQEYATSEERLKAINDHMLPFDSYDLLTTDLELVEYDRAAHHQTWNDMVRLQDSGVYPAAFKVIKQPVLMIHGTDDPHPGQLIYENLRPCLPQIEFRELPKCGHYHWLERHASDEFFRILRGWLLRNL